MVLIFICYWEPANYHTPCFWHFPNRIVSLFLTIILFWTYYPLFPCKQMSKDAKLFSQGQQLISWGKLGQMQTLVYWLPSYCALLYSEFRNSERTRKGLIQWYFSVVRRLKSLSKNCWLEVSPASLLQIAFLHRASSKLPSLIAFFPSRYKYALVSSSLC